LCAYPVSLFCNTIDHDALSDLRAGTLWAT
jgi:hypothetical protein